MMLVGLGEGISGDKAAYNHFGEKRTCCRRDEEEAKHEREQEGTPSKETEHEKIL